MPSINGKSKFLDSKKEVSKRNMDLKSIKTIKEKKTLLVNPSNQEAI